MENSEKSLCSSCLYGDDSDRSKCRDCLIRGRNVYTPKPAAEPTTGKVEPKKDHNPLAIPREQIEKDIAKLKKAMEPQGWEQRFCADCPVRCSRHDADRALCPMLSRIRAEIERVRLEERENMCRFCGAGERYREQNKHRGER